MKTLQVKSAFLAAMLWLFAVSLTGADLQKDKLQKDSVTLISYQGIVMNENTRDKLPFAAVEAVGSNVATVTNIDGEFTLKLEKETEVSSIKVTYLGYISKVVPLTEFSANNFHTITLSPASTQINELTIRPVNGPEFIDEVLKKVAENYNPEPQMMNGFYREAIKNRRKYVAISEAVVDIYKSGYNKSMQFDQVRIDKGRKSADVEKMDTILLKLQGGPAVSLLLDVVKNPYLLLTEDYEKIYDFSLENVISLDDRLHYVVFFRQKPYITDPYYYGRIFIDMDKLAISEAEFSLNIEDENEASRFFIQRKPVGMSILPQAATYRTSYTIDDDQWYFNYARAEVKLKIKWDKRLFNSMYTIMTEIAITDRRTGLAEKINFKERFKRNDVLDDMVYTYFDPDYWGDYNIIEPDQSIESAIRKLNRKFDE